jgi:hypothetical protein
MDLLQVRGRKHHDQTLRIYGSNLHRESLKEKIALTIWTQLLEEPGTRYDFSVAVEDAKTRTRTMVLYPEDTAT